MANSGSNIKYLNRFFTGLYTQRNPLATPFAFAGVVHVVQKDDSLLDGLNVEPSNALVYQRRPGHSTWLAAALGAGETLRNGYTWRRLDGSIFNILDVTKFLSYVPGGGTVKTDLMALSDGEGIVWPLGVGNTLYFASGTHLGKWDTSNLWDWGIETPATAPAIGIGTGALSPKSGYKYVYCFRNSVTGHIGNASPVSGSTGAQTSKNFTITGGTTTDPQVDTVEIYRTQDGGGVYYKLADVTYSASWSYTDSSADTALNTALQAPLDAQNSPPPTGMTMPVWHAGCVWGVVGNKVYFSGGAEILNGVAAECFPPLNFFTFPGPVERLLPSSQGLQVWLRDSRHLVVGVDSTSFVPMPWTEGLGVASPFGLAVDGATVYAFTGKRQLLAIDADGSTEIGFPIGDLLGELNPAAVTLAVHRASSQDSALYVSDGAGNLYRYSLTLQSWATKSTIANGCGWVGSLETEAGTWSLIVAPQTAAGSVLKRDLTICTDAGSTYAAWFVMGNLVLAPPGELASLRYVSATYRNVGTNPTLSLLTDEVSGSFTALTSPVAEPPEFPAASSVTGLRHFVSVSELSQLLRHVQIKVDFGSNSNNTQLLELALTTTKPTTDTPPGVY